MTKSSAWLIKLKRINEFIIEPKDILSEEKVLGIYEATEWRRSIPGSTYFQNSQIHYRHHREEHEPNSQRSEENRERTGGHGQINLKGISESGERSERRVQRKRGERQSGTKYQRNGELFHRGGKNQQKDLEGAGRRIRKHNYRNNEDKD